MKILMTGATGRIGRILRADLSDHDLRLLSRSPIEDREAHVSAVHIADLSELDALREAIRGVDSIIHLAAASAVDSAWDQVLPANIVGARNILEAARLEEVPQVIYASTTHTVAGHERAAAPEIYDMDARQVFAADVEPRPDSLYGASKVFGEALGRWYSDVHGLHVLCLRIGYVSGSRDDEFESPYQGEEQLDLKELTTRKRMRAIWLSHNDCVQLFRRALAAETLPWAVVYATSNNPRQIWDLEPARRLLDFMPEDSAPE
jgi:NAD+ dependent glucose-6-phosphate dehydrogenase